MTPPGSGKLLGDFRSEGHSTTEILFNQTLRMLEHSEKPDENQSDRGVRAVCELWAGLARSNPYTAGVDDLVGAIADPTLSWDWVKKTIDRTLNSWQRDISPVVTCVRTSKVWVVLSDGNNEGRIAPLEGLLAQLGQLAKTMPDAREQQLRDEAGILAQKIQQQNTELSEYLSRYFVNPVNCEATQLPAQLYGEDGSALEVNVDVDPTVGRVLCDLDQLNYVCRELYVNWRKHGVHADGDRKVWFRLYKDRKFVALEFGDLLGGRFDLESWGGIRVAKKFCEDYCGTLESSDPDHSGRKALTIRLRLLPHGITTHNQ
jgi:hypothetical protein